ncbi:MAG: hypothetical protein KDB68_00055 [Planctomycetes bacterium]|nr:hypothetical protein [Planctomycetota bacterium]
MTGFLVCAFDAFFVFPLTTFFTGFFVGFFAGFLAPGIGLGFAPVFLGAFALGFGVPARFVEVDFDVDLRTGFLADLLLAGFLFVRAIGVPEGKRRQIIEASVLYKRLRGCVGNLGPYSHSICG